MKARRITEKLREELHRPIGPLLNEREALRALAEKKPKMLIAVGDTCGYMLLKNKVKPDIFVFDYKNLRVPVSPEVRAEIERHVKKKKTVKSEAGTISAGMEKAVVEALKKGSGNIFVQGEEDLAALVALAHAPEKSVVIYGQPNEGVVFIETGRETSEKARKWLEEFEKI